MIPLMRSADLAICSAGLTLFELACLGTPVVVICAEIFEEETAQYMEKNGFGINLGFGERVPKFAKRYADVRSLAVEGTRKFVEEVKSGMYPAEEHCYSMNEGEYSRLLAMLNGE